MKLDQQLPGGDPAQGSDPERIAGLLTLSTERLDTDTVKALERARQIALERQAVSAPVFALDSGTGLHWPTLHWPGLHRHMPHSPRQWVAAALLLAVVVSSAAYWQHHRHHEMMAHLDVSILTDDLPMEVFIDR